MIWVDSSFAVEWLAGTERAEKVQYESEPLGILPSQYAETFVLFLKKGFEPENVAQQLESLEIKHPENIHLQLAAKLYLEARKSPKSKASLADAILAAVAYHRHEKILAFDGDFKDLGFKEKNGVWSI